MKKCPALESFSPVQVSSSYEQKRGENPQQHPTACCGPETAGYQCRDPARYKNNKHIIQR